MADAYTPTDGLKNVTSFPTDPADETAARKQVQDVLDQMLAFHNTHLAEAVYYVASATRNLGVAGVQTITLPFEAKKIEVRATVLGTKMFSVGAWAENGIQSRMSCGDAGNWDASSGMISISKSGVYQVIASVQNITATGFELNWSIITGTPTDTANITIVASAH
jgi:hypothetical protein